MKACWGILMEQWWEPWKAKGCKRNQRPNAANSSICIACLRSRSCTVEGHAHVLSTVWEVESVETCFAPFQIVHFSWLQDVNLVFLFALFLFSVFVFCLCPSCLQSSKCGLKSIKNRLHVFGSPDSSVHFALRFHSSNASKSDKLVCWCLLLLYGILYWIFAGLNRRWLESGKVDLVMNSAKDRISSAWYERAAQKVPWKGIQYNCYSNLMNRQLLHSHYSRGFYGPFLKTFAPANHFFFKTTPDCQTARLKINQTVQKGFVLSFRASSF